MARRLPLWMADAFSWVAAWFWWYFLPIRRKETVERLRTALPEVPAGPTLRRMMHDLVLGYFEILQFDRLQIEVTGAEGPAARPGPMLAGHLGSWDIVALGIADAVPVALFLRTIRDPWVRARLSELRDAHHIHRLESGSTLADADAAYALGRSVIFVQDQRYNKGPAVPLFGSPARTSPGFAVSILKNPGLGVWTVTGWRVGPGRHRIHFAPFEGPELTSDRAADVLALTAAANRWYEAEIRQRPWSWLWLHRRWK
jgi:KDO2-lipid IV(A) lauroyltransferase